MGINWLVVGRAAAWGHMILALIGVGLAVSNCADVAANYRDIRRLKVNGLYRVMSTGDLARSLSTVGLMALLAVGSSLRVYDRTPYPYTGASVVSYLMLGFVVVPTATDWLIRRRVMTAMLLHLTPPPDPVAADPPDPVI